MNLRARVALALIVTVAALLLGGCNSTPVDSSGDDARPTRPLQDGTPEFRADIMSIPDAVPRPEPVTIAGNKSPYSVLGSTYRVTPVPAGHRERGYGSWYGTKFHGQNTSNGEPYDVYAMTAAHKTLPIPSYVRVTNLENGRRVVVRVNDRGPFHDGRVIDLSYAAAYKLGYAGTGTAPVELEVLDPNAPEWVARRMGIAAPAEIAQAATPSPRPAPMPPAAAAAAAAERRTWLQAGAFRSIEGARSLQRSLSTLLGREASIHASDSGGGSWYRVRVGPMADAGEVHEAQRRIAAASLGEARIVSE